MGYTINKAGGNASSGDSKAINITPIDDSIYVEKNETSSEVEFRVKANGGDHRIESSDRTIDVSGDPSHGYDLSAKTSLLRKVFVNDDAAVANLGSDYRMPSLEDFRELIENCSVEKLVNNNTWGFYLRYISNINGNSILFPLLTDGEGESHVETNYPARKCCSASIRMPFCRFSPCRRTCATLSFIL